MKKTMILVFFLVFSMLNFAGAQTIWNYTEYKTIYKDGVKQFTLEYGVNQNGYDGKVKWRLTNYTNTIYYNVSINDKRYTLSNSQTREASSETFFYGTTFGPGQLLTTTDAVNSNENYGNWSDKNDNPVTGVKVGYPEIELALEKNGATYPWDNLNAKNSNENSLQSNNQNQNNTNSLSSKKSKYLEYIEEGNRAYTSKNWEQAKTKYYLALSMDFDPDMYPDLPTRNSVLQKYSKVKQNIQNSSKNQTSRVDANPYEPNYNNNNWNNTNNTSYNNAGSNKGTSSNESNQAANGYREQWADDYEKQYENTQREYEANLEEFQNTLVGIAQMYNQASREAQLKKEKAERERREKEAERMRIEAEKRERERKRRQMEYEEKVRAMNRMEEFEKVFSNNYNRNIRFEKNEQKVFFYFAHLDKDFDSKSGNFLYSNIFSVSRLSANYWPFIADIEDDISKITGKYYMKGYFNSLKEAQWDRNKMIGLAQNAGLYTKKRYNFSYNTKSHLTFQKNNYPPDDDILESEMKYNQRQYQQAVDLLNETDSPVSLWIKSKALFKQKKYNESQLTVDKYFKRNTDENQFHYIELKHLNKRLEEIKRQEKNHLAKIKATRGLDEAREFLIKFPYSDDRKTVEKIIRDLDNEFYRKTASKNSVEGYNQYLKVFPNGEYQKVCTRKLHEAELAIANSKNSAEAFDYFIKKYPDSHLLGEAILGAARCQYNNFDTDGMIRYYALYLSIYNEEDNYSVKNEFENNLLEYIPLADNIYDAKRYSRKYIEYFPHGKKSNYIEWIANFRRETNILFLTDRYSKYGLYFGNLDLPIGYDWAPLYFSIKTNPSVFKLIFNYGGSIDEYGELQSDYNLNLTNMAEQGSLIVTLGGSMNIARSLWLDIGVGVGYVSDVVEATSGDVTYYVSRKIDEKASFVISNDVALKYDLSFVTFRYGISHFNFGRWHQTFGFGVSF